MDQVSLIGRNERLERNLYLAIVDDLTTWTPDLSTVPPPFAALCVLDSRNEGDAALEAFASRLLAAGCEWMCGWGPDGEGDLLHDVFDDVFAREMQGEWEEDDNVVTTAHDGETIDEALWFAIFNTSHPWHDIPSVLAVVSPLYAEHVARRLADSDQLSADVVGNEAG